MTDTAKVTVETRGASQQLELVEGELVTVGRSSSCALQIKDHSVSREHCVAVFAHGKVCVSDLASTHGLYFRGKTVDRCELAPGESCQLGNAHLLFEAPAGSARSTRPASTAGPAASAQAPPPAPAPERRPPAEDDEPPADPDGDAAADGTFAPPPGLPAAEIAGYRILEPLGEGGFGVVYRAQQTRLGREVALKVLRPKDAVDETRIEAFAREARAAAAINDPHLVQVFDVGQDQGTHYLSMELVPGGSLARRIKRGGPLEWREVLSLIRDMARALRAAHERGLVHRDVKPANILLTADGQAKLTDLGLASGIVEAGTVAFMAPEQLLRREVDGRADIYALGCTAYAALTGRPPFAGSRQEVARAHVRQAPESLQRRGIQLPWHLEQLIVDSMMAKDPADRPQNADELLARLDRLILPGGSLVGTGSPGPRALAGGAAGAAEPAPRIRYVRSPRKELAARIVSETIVVSIVSFVIIAALLALKYRWPDIDIYRLIGK